MGLPETIYLDTREGAQGVFACPPALQVTYEEYLRDAIAFAVQRQRITPIVQKLNAAVYAAIHQDTELLAIGPHAGAVAKVVEDYAGNTFEVTVLDNSNLH